MSAELFRRAKQDDAGVRAEMWCALEDLAVVVLADFCPFRTPQAPREVPSGARNVRTANGLAKSRGAAERRVGALLRALLVL